MTRIPALAVLAATLLVFGTTTASAAGGPAPPGAPVAPGSFVNARGDHCFRSAAAAVTGICAHPVRDPAAIAQRVRSLDPAGRALRRSMLSSAPASRAAAPAGVERVADVPPPPPQCNFGHGGFLVTPDRFTSCTDVIWELYTFTTDANGLIHITGSLNLEDLQWTSYSVSSLTWTHGLVMGIFQGEGTLVDGAPAEIHSACDFATVCTVSGNLGTPGNQLQGLEPGTQITDGWTERDTGDAASASGRVDVQSLLGVLFVGPGLGPDVPPWSFQDSYLIGRCDSVVGSSPGCVNQAFTPTLDLQVSRYGASADMVRWGQRNLGAHWGQKGAGQPLHRLTDDIIAGNNREILCQDGSFTPDQSMNEALRPYNDQDTCDEFPFASTYESGAMDHDADGNPKPHVTSGAQCAQVTAVQTGTSGTNEAADWAAVAPLGSHTGLEACVRGHIPGKLNSAVGGAYSAAIQANRLVDRDPFWVSVT